MVDNIDKRYVTDDFLMDKIPSPDKFCELSSNPPKSTLAVSEERYLTMQENINRALQGTGINLADSHLATIIKNMDGYVVISKTLKPNKQL